MEYQYSCFCTKLSSFKKQIPYCLYITQDFIILVSITKQQRQKITESVKISLRRLAKAIQITPVCIDIFNGVNYTFHLTFPNEQISNTVYNLIANNILPAFTYNLAQNAEENQSLFEFEGFCLQDNQLVGANFPQTEDQQFIRNKKDAISLAVKQFLNNEQSAVDQQTLEHFLFDNNIIIDVSAIASTQSIIQDLQQQEQLISKEYLNQLLNQFKESKKYFEQVSGGNVKLLIDTEIEKIVRDYNKELIDQQQQPLTKDDVLEQKMQDYWIQKRSPILNNIYQGGQGNVQLETVDDNTVTALISKYCKFMQLLTQFSKENCKLFNQNYILPYHLRNKDMTVVLPQVTPEFEQQYQQNLQWWQQLQQQKTIDQLHGDEGQFHLYGPIQGSINLQGIWIQEDAYQQQEFLDSVDDNQHQHYPNQPEPLQEIIMNNLQVKQICCKEAQTLNIDRSQMDIAIKDEIIKLLVEQQNKFQLLTTYQGLQYQVQIADQEPQEIICGFNQTGDFIFPSGDTREQINQIGEDMNLAPHFVNVQLGTEIGQQKVFSGEKQINLLINSIENILLQKRQFKINQLLQDKQTLIQTLQNLTYNDLYTDLSGKVLYNTQISAVQTMNKDLTSDNSNESLIPDISTQYLKCLQQNYFTDIDKFARGTCKLPQIFTKYYRTQLNPDAFNHFLSFDAQFVQDLTQEGQQLEEADNIQLKDAIPYIIKLYISQQQEKQILDVVNASDEFRDQFLPQLADVIQKMLLRGEMKIWQIQKLLQQLQIPEYFWIYLIQQFNVSTLYKEAFLQIIAHFTGRFIQAKMRCSVRRMQQCGPQEYDTQQNLWFMSEFQEDQQDSRQIILDAQLKNQVAMLLNQLLSLSSDGSIYEEVAQFIDQLYYKQSFSKVKLIIDPQVLFGYNLETISNGKETIQLKRQFLEEICRVCGFIIGKDNIDFADNLQADDITAFYPAIVIQNEEQALQQLVFGDKCVQQVKQYLLNYKQELQQITLQKPTAWLSDQEQESTSFLLHQLEFIIQYRGQLHPDQNSMNIICNLLNSLARKPLNDQTMNLINVIILKIKASIQYQPISCKLQFYKTYINILRQIQIQSPNIQKSNYKALFFEDTLQISHLQSQYQTLINIYLNETSIEYIRELIDLMIFYDKTNQLPKAIEISTRLLQLCEEYYEGSDIFIEVSILSGKLQFKAENYIKSIKNYENTKIAVNQKIEKINKTVENLNSQMNLLNGQIPGTQDQEKQILINKQKTLLSKLNNFELEKEQLLIMNATLDGLITQSATRNGTADLYQKLLENSIKVVNKIQPESELLCDLMGQMADILISQNKLLDSTVYLNFIVQKQKNLKIDSDKKFENFKKLIFYTIKAANKDVQKVYKQILAEIELNEVKIQQTDVIDVVKKIIVNENPQLVISEWFLNVIQDGDEQSYWKLVVLFSYINQCEIYIEDDILMGQCNIVETPKEEQQPQQTDENGDIQQQVEQQPQQKQAVSKNIPPLRYNELLEYEAKQ